MDKKIQIKRGSAQFLMGIDQVAQLDEWLAKNPGILGIALVGRSNVGKSTLINSLFGKSIARTSKTPGRTRQINIFQIELENHESEIPLYLFDLPGYGHAQVSKQMAKNWNNLMATFFSYLSINILLLNIQDARHPNQTADQKFQDFLKEYDNETFLVFNKLDKLKTQKDRSILEKLKPQLFEQYKWVKQVFFVSAENKKGIPNLEDSIVNYLLKKEQATLV